jgi:SsrA-binding protein
VSYRLFEKPALFGAGFIVGGASIIPFAMPRKAAHSPEVRNRDALRDYFVDQTLEAGIVLTGGEVKSVRAALANFTGAYAAVDKNCVMLYGLRIEPYRFASTQKVEDADRPKKLLLKSRELEHLRASTQAEGYTLVPLKLYFKGSLIKIALGLGKGKKKFDKRADLKERAVRRETDRFFKLRRQK